MNPLRQQFPLAGAALTLIPPMRAEEVSLPANLGSSTLNGYVDTSASFGSGAVVPEPGVLALGALGTAVLLFASRRFRRRE